MIHLENEVTLSNGKLLSQIQRRLKLSVLETCLAWSRDAVSQPRLPAQGAPVVMLLPCPAPTCAAGEPRQPEGSSVGARRLGRLNGVPCPLSCGPRSTFAPGLCRAVGGASHSSRIPLRTTHCTWWSRPFSHLSSGTGPFTGRRTSVFVFHDIGILEEYRPVRHKLSLSLDLSRASS